jgi:SAM-dependent methyltransferase
MTDQVPSIAPQIVATDENLLEVALVDYFAGVDMPLHYLRNADGYEAVYDMADWFDADITLPLELRALSFCLPGRRILDVGAGVGRHAVALQRRGVESVVAIDIMPRAVAIMRQRGVEQSFCVDVLAAELYDAARWSGASQLPVVPSSAAERDHAAFLDCVGAAGALFDTALLLSDTIGFVGTEAGARELLTKLHRWVAEGGQVLIDCSDIELEIANNPSEHVDFVAQQPPEAYVGQSEMHLEYRGRQGRSFNWLYLSFAKLSEIAGECGWRCFMLQRNGSEYLAELRRAHEQPGVV